MSRKPILRAMIATAAFTLLAAACGSDGQGAESTDVSTDESTDVLPDVSTDVSPDVSTGYTYPTGADDVVFEYSELGGFVPREVAFQSIPSMLVSGDGLVFTPGAQVLIYPGPLLPSIQVQTFTDEGIERLLAAADEAGLFADVEYETDPTVADAATATVVIAANGDIWTHEAYALGIGSLPGDPGEPGTTDGASPDSRQALADFVSEIADLGGLVGTGELGATEIYEPAAYAIQALVVADPSDFSGDGFEPTIVAWPQGASVRLRDADSCVVIPAAEISDVLESADQLTLLSDMNVIYQVLAKPDLPGDPCPDQP